MVAFRSSTSQSSGLVSTESLTPAYGYYSPVWKHALIFINHYRGAYMHVGWRFIM